MFSIKLPFLLQRYKRNGRMNQKYIVFCYFFRTIVCTIICLLLPVIRFPPYPDLDGGAKDTFLFHAQ